MAFTLKNAEDYYTTPVNAETNNIYNLTDKNIKKYITKTIKAGEMLECEIYPTWKTKPLQRGSKINPSRKAQANLNNNNTKKNLVRLINSNFTKEDI
ncbi:hypothetical protein LJB89_03905, partial [Tyzzerella sp. OttesenSCG-928-J15]|nr:hypothetical protein [Tyzzerella sp. OttesenSCG-928-J15]